MTALHIKTNGEKKEVVPEYGSFFSLMELQAFVGGNITFLITKNQQTMVVNEEGRLKNLPINAEASELVNYDKGVVGDVLVCDWTSLQG